MTVTSTIFSQDFTAAGTAGGGETFVFGFAFTDASEIKVFTTAGTLITDLLFGTDFTVSPVLGSSSGGTVLVSKVLTGGDKVTVQRFVDATQPTDFSGTGPLDVESVEKQEDRAVMMSQQLHGRTGGVAFSSSEDRRIAGKTGSTTDWDAKTGKIANVVDPLVDQEAATKKYVDDQIIGAGNVVLPVAGEEGFVHRADPVSIGVFGWDSIGQTLGPVAADVDRALVATGLNTFAFQDTFKGNFILNSGFRVRQRGSLFTAASVPANDDDTYLLDQWILLSDGNDIVDVSQELTDIPNEAYAACELNIQTLLRKAGTFQILEARDSRRLIENDTGVVSLSFKVRNGGPANIVTCRAAILSWTGAFDEPTSDWINVWGADGTNPTPVAPNWVLENVPANLTVTGSFTTVKVENIPLNAVGTNNVGVFIWIDASSVTAVGDILFIADVQLEPGPTAHPYVQKLFQEEVNLCQRYYFKTFNEATAPATFAGKNGALVSIADDAGSFAIPVRFPTPMFISTVVTAPTILLFNPDAANSNVHNEDGNTDTPANAVNVGDSGCYIEESPIDAGDAHDKMVVHVTAEAVL